MLLALAILFGSLVAPETAHAENLPGDHSIEVLEVHNHAEADDQKDQQQNGGSPCHALVHHHCSIAIAVDAGAASLLVRNAKAAVMPLIVQPMASLALAPPAEPPAA
jgi:hypothetical protein